LRCIAKKDFLDFSTDISYNLVAIVRERKKGTCQDYSSFLFKISNGNLLSSAYLFPEKLSSNYYDYLFRNQAAIVTRHIKQNVNLFKSVFLYHIYIDVSPKCVKCKLKFKGRKKVIWTWIRINDI